MEQGLIFNIQRFCMHDGPGVRTVVFLKGCSLKCKWCSNPESQLPKPELMYTVKLCHGCGNCVANCSMNAFTLGPTGLKIDRSLCNNCGKCHIHCYYNALEVSGVLYTVDELLNKVLKDRAFYETSGGGVTLSGGEPLLQQDFNKKFLKKLKSRGIHTTVETAGLVEWEVFESLREDIDLFLFDIKQINDEAHRLGTGKSNRKILDNLKRLKEKGSEIIIRYPLIPNYNMSDADIAALSDFINEIGLDTIHLLPYHRLGRDKYDKLGWNYELTDLLTPPKEEVERIAAFLEQKSRLKVVIGG